MCQTITNIVTLSCFVELFSVSVRIKQTRYNLSLNRFSSAGRQMVLTNSCCFHSLCAKLSKSNQLLVMRAVLILRVNEHVYQEVYKEGSGEHVPFGKTVNL